VRRPLLSGAAAAGFSFVLVDSYGQLLSPLLRLVFGGATLGISYIGMLFWVMGEKAFYLDIIRGLTGRRLEFHRERAAI
jgi:hypothetical protein